MPSPSIGSSLTPPGPLTLADFQKHISQRYEAVDRARGPAKTFVWFMEEVGEFATAINTVEKSPQDAAARQNLEEEVADVFAWLCTLANILDVDIQKAVQAKYLGEKRPEGHK
jgi:NTP pyrophosphatase (non-canonical NTP hydrolase)